MRASKEQSSRKGTALIFSLSRLDLQRRRMRKPNSTSSLSLNLTLSSLGDERRTSERSIMVLLDREDGGDEREEEEAAAATVAAAALDEEARVNIGLRRGRVFFFFFFCGLTSLLRSTSLPQSAERAVVVF